MVKCAKNLIVKKHFKPYGIPYHGNLRTSNDDEIKPWDGNKYKNYLSQNDFPIEAIIIKANMLYLNKEGFSNKALNIIKRMSSFKNPEFYKSQAMRLSTHDKPRIISLFEETTKYLCIPRGCETELNELLLNYNVDNKYIDIFNPKNKPPIEIFKFST